MELEILEAFEELPEELRKPLLKFAKAIQKAIGETVRRADFIELKEVVSTLAHEVGELAQAQKRTEEKLTRLEGVVGELAQAQKRTEEKLTRLEGVVGELAQAQKRTEEKLTRLEGVVGELAQAQKRTEEEIRKLSEGLSRTRREVGGLARSVAYALENEAYRRLPEFLRETYGIEIQKRLIRAEISDEEINIYARVRKDGEELVLVGEAVLRLDDATKLRQLLRKAKVVEREQKAEVLPLIITHFAKRKLLERARKSGVIVVQSFEWS